MALTKISHDDNDKAVFGTSEDLKIFHDGSNSYIEEDGAGQIIIRGWGPRLQAGYSPTSSRNTGEDAVVCVTDGTVELYYDGSKKLETTANGVLITGNDTGSFVKGDFTFDNQTNAGKDCWWDQSDNRLGFSDDVRIKMGNGADLQIYHGGTDSVINNGTGHFYIQGENQLTIKANNNVEILKATGDEAMAKFIPDGAVELYYNNTKMLETYSNGVKLDQGANSHLWLSDNSHLRCGTGNDLKIYHSSGINFIQGANSANIYACADDFAVLNQAATKTAIWCNSGGSTDLFYNNAKKFETNSSGAQVTGSLVADSVAVGDNEPLLCGNDDDLSIKHNNTNATIQNNKGVLYIHNDAAGLNEGVCILNDYFWVNNEANTENIITAQANGAVNLFNDGVKRLETWGSGVKTFGTYFETNNVTTYNVSFYQQNNQSYSYDIDVGSEGGAGNSFWLVCGYNHYYNTAYGAHRVGMFSARTTSVDTIFEDNQTSGNAGAWSVSKPGNATFRVTKSAGSYGGWGHGFVQLTFRKL